MKQNEKLIKDFVKENKTTLRQLAKDCKMSYGTLRKIMNDKCNVKVFYLFNLSKKTNIKVDVLLKNKNN